MTEQTSFSSGSELSGGSASEVRPIGDGGPAFPVEVDATQPNERQTGNTLYQTYGMTLRDYFAATAMQGWLASYSGENRHPCERQKGMLIAELSYEMADAMLCARATHPT